MGIKFAVSYSWGFVPFRLICVFAAGEEFGWRGYALDRLQGRFNAIISSIVLGVIWWAWHIPALGNLSGISGGQTINVWLYLVAILECAVLFTWICNNTNGSILVAILFHATLNTAVMVVVPIAEQVPAYSILYYYSPVVLLIIVIAVTMVYGPERLVRKTKKQMEVKL